MAIAAGAAVPFDGLWLDAPPETMRARVASRTGDASDATPGVVDAQLFDQVAEGRLAAQVATVRPSTRQVEAAAYGGLAAGARVLNNHVHDNAGFGNRREYFGCDSGLVRNFF